ncbi:hypothetical protein QYF36_003476 [Acer negundo]|nr:hypothetical protein QYF36_003476 [Acer negundo]
MYLQKAPESRVFFHLQSSLMAKGKLILICQSGGKFVTKDDGSISYDGGEANAMAINPDTQFDDLKLRLAELCNVELKSLSIKYFIPGNRRNLITLSNDKDLKRMYEFHGDSVTADVIVMGTAGFDRESLARDAGRENGIKLAETVPASTPSQADTRRPASTSSKTAARRPVSSKAAARRRASTSSKAAARRAAKVATDSETVISDPSGDHHTPSSPVTDNADRNAHSPIILDMNASPADTVKKRRRAASRKNSAYEPSTDEDSESDGERRKVASRKKNVRNRNPTAEKTEQQPTSAPWLDDLNFTVTVDNSNNATPEKLVALWKGGITGIGQEFKSVHEFRDALQKYAIAHRFTYRLKKNDTNRASGRCLVEGCSWRIHASWVPSEQVFKIKKMNETHTCEGESWKAGHRTKSWLVGIIKNKLRESPHPKPKEIAADILRDFGVELNYTQVWRGIDGAREQLQGSYKEAYNQLPGFCDKLLEANPGSFVNLCIGDDKKFQRLFVCFHASIHGFQNGCRPLLFLDSTSLKSKHHEILLTATAVDGDDCVFPVAFALVDVEHDDNWNWFLEQLRSAVSTSESITFVSDKQKGLMESVLKVFENAHHGYSIYHLLDDFIKNLKGPFHGDGKCSLPVDFLTAAQAARREGFRMSAEQIRRISSKAFDWIMQIEPEYWTYAAFKGEHYHQITFDVAETYAKWIEEVRDLPIIQKLEVLHCKMTDLINSRRTESGWWSTKLIPSKEERLKEESQKALKLKVLFSTDTLFEVRDECTNIIDMVKQECSCGGWKITGIPCRHVIAVFNCTGKSGNVYDYCSRYLTVDRYRSTYSESINPVAVTLKTPSKEKAKSPSESTEVPSESEAEQVLPPSTSKKPSQQKRKWTSEGFVPRTVTCTKCKGVGHNKISCKETV